MKKKKYKENVFYSLLFAVFIFLLGILVLYQASQGRHYIIEVKDGTPWDIWQLVGFGISLIGCALYLWRCAMKEKKKNDEHKT